MNTTLAMLAGGQASRMGQPKAELRIRDQPILQYLLDNWKWNGPTLLVTAPGREHPPGWTSFDREAVDPVPRQGPLRGIVTAIECSPSAQAVVVTTCDMPLVTSVMLKHLAATLDVDPRLLAVMTQHESQLEPFPIALRPIILDMLKERLASNDHSVRSLAKLEGISVIDAPSDWSATVWTNLNSPEDYRKFVTDYT